MISASHGARKFFENMKTTLNKLGLASFARLAKKLDACMIHYRPDGSVLLPLNFETFLKEGEDMYAWNWENGFTRIHNPRTIVGQALSLLSSGTMPQPANFSHVAIHRDNLIFVYRCDDVEVQAWKDEFDFNANQPTGIDFEARNYAHVD